MWAKLLSVGEQETLPGILRKTGLGAQVKGAEIMHPGKWYDRFCICSRKTCQDMISIISKRTSHAPVCKNARRNYFYQLLSSATTEQTQKPQNVLKLYFNDMGISHIISL